MRLAFIATPLLGGLVWVAFVPSSDFMDYWALGSGWVLTTVELLYSLLALRSRAPTGQTPAEMSLP